MSVSQEKPLRKTRRWFTLVELIVVITILAILGGLGFISLMGYQSSARDSGRVSDLTNISKALDLALVRSGSYPTPDNSFNVTYSGGVVWTQWSVGNATLAVLSSLWGVQISNKPVDPLTKKEYVYSKTAFGNAYQIRADWETGNIAYGSAFISEAHAASNNMLAYIRGTYNGMVTRTQTGGINYFIASPSIVTSQAGLTGSGYDIVSQLGGKILYHGMSSTDGASFTGKLIYASSSVFPSNNIEKALFATEIANAYSGSTIANQSSVQTFISATSNGDTRYLASLGTHLIKGDLGGTTSSVDTTGWTPSIVPNPYTKIGAGRYHTCAITSWGGVKCWWYNADGPLGNGTVTSSTTPVNVTGLTANVASLAVGAMHSCALTTSGWVKCWGYNFNGQVGDGSTTTRLSPVDVVGLTSGVMAISVGRFHSCALLDTGNMKCWGYNFSGQLGDGTTTDSTIPVNVGGFAVGGIAAISVGANHTCAITTGGWVKCWGSGTNARLWNGTINVHSSVPLDVTGLTSWVKLVRAGTTHTCAILVTGGMKCWGSNSSGQLGDGTTTTPLTPVDASTMTGGISGISSGGFYHTCASMTSGWARCWGYNGNGDVNYAGAVGDGTTTNRLTPVSVTSLSNSTSSITAWEYHSCTITTSGWAKCWGKNTDGQLGDGTSTNRVTPVDVVGF